MSEDNVYVHDNNTHKKPKSVYQQLSGILNALKTEEITVNEAMAKIQLKDTTAAAGKFGSAASRRLSQHSRSQRLRKQPNCWCELPHGDRPSGLGFDADDQYPWAVGRPAKSILQKPI